MALPASPASTPADIRDNDLVARAKDGDDEAWEALVLRYRRSAYVLALQLVGNPDDALDVAQDALLRFFTKIHRFQGQRPVRPWLLAIVRNRARDLLRRRRVRRAEPLESDETTYRPELIDPAPGPEAASRRKELRRRIWQALGQLPDAQREILVLRDYQDLSYAEIAGVLEIPMGTVMSRLHRARANLRQLLRAESGAQAATPPPQRSEP